jgi:hypothetical protein
MVEEALAAIEAIEPGQKLSFKGGKVEIVDNPSRIGRWLSGENKHTTIEGITKIVDTAISSGVPISYKFSQALENLKMTYHKSKSMMIEFNEMQRKIKEYSYEFMLRPR